MLSSRQVGHRLWDRSCCLQMWFLLWICRTTPRVRLCLVWTLRRRCLISNLCVWGNRRSRDRVVYLPLGDASRGLCSWMVALSSCLPAGLSWKTANVKEEKVCVWSFKCLWYVWLFQWSIMILPTSHKVVCGVAVNVRCICFQGRCSHMWYVTIETPPPVLTRVPQLSSSESRSISLMLARYLHFAQ